jgi:RHH-type transcriptional regulator, proline utilization regulon repressor / proline dehydrogenase / delta 1-pyrroline-5-carboxylate dehydrogenase
MIERESGRRRLAFQSRLPAGLESLGTYVPPTVFTDVPPSASIAREEIFGPVVADPEGGTWTRPSASRWTWTTP